MESTTREVVAADGQVIVGKFFRPSSTPSAAVLIAPAMGALQTYYSDFARWLADRGILAATFDYRGVGLSRWGSLRGFDADIMDWARLDCAAMIDAVAERSPGVPLYWIGHSLGGQIFPFVPNRERVAKFVTVATGSGYWRENAAPLRRTVWWMWYVVVPLSLRSLGYFPGRRLRKVGDLPYGVMKQWRAWCLNPDYAVGAEGAQARAEYASIAAPVVSLSFTDDEFMSARNTESIHRHFSGATVTMKRIAPEDIGASRIGHFGFFRAKFKRALWTDILLPELA